MSSFMRKIGNSRAARVILSAALAGATGLGVVAASPTAAAAATPKCNAEWYFKSSSGDFNVWAPAYKSGSSYTKVCTLSQGNSGSGVASLQQAMKQCNGFSSISVDGSFGDETWFDLYLLQASLKITADGIYGSQTRGAMKFPLASDGPDTSCGRLS